MSEKFSCGTINSTQTNKQKPLFRIYNIDVSKLTLMIDNYKEKSSGSKTSKWYNVINVKFNRPYIHKLSYSGILFPLVRLHFKNIKTRCKIYLYRSFNFSWLIHIFCSEISPLKLPFLICFIERLDTVTAFPSTEQSLYLLFACLGFIIPLESFSLIRRRHHYLWMAANFDLCSALFSGHWAVRVL